MLFSVRLLVITSHKIPDAVDDLNLKYFFTALLDALWSWSIFGVDGRLFSSLNNILNKKWRNHLKLGTVRTLWDIIIVAYPVTLPPAWRAPTKTVLGTGHLHQKLVN